MALSKILDTAQVVNFLSMGCRWASTMMQIEEQDRGELVCAVMTTWWWALALQVVC